MSVRVLPDRPDWPDAFAYVTPAPLLRAMRVLTAVLATALVAFSIHDWPAMPPAARVFVCVLAPAMALVAALPAAWRQRPWFVAGPEGIAFPDDRLLVETVGVPSAGDWLFVPWSDVDAVRVSRLGGAAPGPCVAMRVRVIEADRARWFARIPAAVDSVDDPQWLELAWAEALPRPAQVVAALDALRGRHPLPGATAGRPSGDAGTACDRRPAGTDATPA